MKINSRFIIVKHDAKKARLHYDLRFRMPKSKMWISFAVRKGVPTEFGQKVLAVRTHDHDEKEALFLGTIKQGYGAGKLSKYDGGSCTIIKYHSSHMIVDFKGSKIKGVYHLINTGVINKKEFKKQNYILFKGKVLNESREDAFAGCGMISRIPPGDTQDVEIDDETADSQQKKPLKWSITKPKRVVAAEQLYLMLKRYNK